MKMLDFNAIQRPLWPVKLKDDAQTVVHLTAPTVELLDRLIALAPDLEEVAKAKDGKTVRAAFALIADVLACNDDGYTFTAEELRDKYRLTLFDLILFVSGYLDFVKEIQNAKN